MNKIKMVGSRFLKITLSLLIVLSMGQMVHANTIDEIWVNGTNISTAPANTVQCGDGTAVYDKTTNTLTLNDAQITQTNVAGYGIEYKLDTDFNIVLQGSNSINIKETTAVFAYTEGNMTFSGDGSLDIEAKMSISNHKNITFDNVTINSTASEAGSIVADGNVIIKNGSNITSSGTHFGFHAGGDLTITGSDVTAVASAENMNAISATGEMKIEKESTVNASSFYPGLFSNGDISIADSEVTANATGDWGIWSKSNLTISGDSEVISKGLTGSVGASNSFKITPALDKTVEIFLGADEDNVTALEGSPFSAETDLKALDVGANLYFHSKTHTHVASEDWSKDDTNHWYECTANDDEKLDLATHSCGEWVIDTPATETTKGSKHRDCTVCGQSETAEIPVISVTPDKPTITSGAGSTHQISSGKNMTFTCSGKLEDLTGIYVDGKLVDESNYTLKSGNTILTLKASYLDTLSVGKHTLKFQYKDSISAETNFTITAKDDDQVIKDTASSKTSDNSAMYAFLLFVSGCAVGTVTYRKKKSINK